jgi:hypothetical protein
MMAVFTDRPTYRCGFCHYDFGNWNPGLGTPCPQCGHIFGGIKEDKFVKPPYQPGVGLAILSTGMSFFIPVLPMILAIYIAIRSQQWATRIIAIIGVGINLLISATILYAIVR